MSISFSHYVHKSFKGYSGQTGENEAKFFRSQKHEKRHPCTITCKEVGAKQVSTCLDYWWNKMKTMSMKQCQNDDLVAKIESHVSVVNMQSLVRRVKTEIFLVPIQFSLCWDSKVFWACRFSFTWKMFVSYQSEIYYSWISHLIFL